MHVFFSYVKNPGSGWLVQDLESGSTLSEIQILLSGYAIHCFHSQKSMLPPRSTLHLHCVSVRTWSQDYIKVNGRLFKTSTGWSVMSPPKTSGLFYQERRNDWIWKVTGSHCYNFIFLIMKVIYTYSINIQETWESIPFQR